MARKRSIALALATLAVAQTALTADVLPLRDGRRIEGTLVAVRDDTIEFDAYGGRDRLVRRYDRADVRSIQFDDVRGVGVDRFDRGRDNPGFDRGRDDGRARPGMRERVVSVEARTAWTDSGIDVRAGQELFFSATGEVRWGPNRRDGAGGERNSPRNNGRPMPDRNAAALIGRIGPDGDPFFIGDDTQAIRVRGGGRLFLGLNDDYLLDNSGALRVTIAY
jgi:hypothetical protein